MSQREQQYPRLYNIQSLAHRHSVSYRLLHPFLKIQKKEQEGAYLFVCLVCFPCSYLHLADLKM